MPDAHPIETYIARPLDAVARFLAAPWNFPRWAAVDAASFRQIGALEWSAETEFGPRIVRFSPPNDEGIFDHAIYAAGEEPVMMPMRIAADSDGTRVSFLFYQRAGMDSEQLASALEWIRTDFAVLKALLEV